MSVTNDEVSSDIAEATGVDLLDAAVRRTLNVAWMAILLGIVVQGIVVIGKHLAGAAWPGIQLLIDLAQGVTWALLVCAGVAIGTVASKYRSSIMGILGLLAGPIAWGIAKGVQKVMQNLMSTPVDQVGSFFYLMCAVKGVEYALLGAALGHLSQRASTRLGTYAVLGGAIGAATMIVVVLLNYTHSSNIGVPFPPPKIVGMALSELMFPVGCSMVIAVATRFKAHAKIA